MIEIDNNTALETAELVALQKIGGPMKLSGSNLCYADRVDWGSRLDGSVVSRDKIKVQRSGWQFQCYHSIFDFHRGKNEKKAMLLFFAPNLQSRANR